MSGYRTYQKMQDLERRCNAQGFVLDGCGRHGAQWSLHWDPSQHGDRDEFYIRVPEDDGTILPIYTRGIEMFVGNLTECLCWIRGWEKHQEYVNFLKFGKKIAAAERKTADHYKGERLKKAIMEGQDPGYSGVLPDSKANETF